jgi:membrane protein implicated in regulation of membrane protease activity
LRPEKQSTTGLKKSLQERDALIQHRASLFARAFPKTWRGVKDLMQITAFHGYLLLFLIGIIYAVATAVLSGALGGDFGGDHNVDTGGHGDMGAGADSGMVHISPLSPTVIATFMTAFGGTGIICVKAFAMSGYTSLPVAIVVGLGVATAIFALFEWIFKKTQSSVNIDAAQMVGTRADVITPIPEKGVGEIAFIACGIRQNSPARSVDGRPIESPAEVEIVRVVGGSYVVRRVGPPLGPPKSSAS